MAARFAAESVPGVLSADDDIMQQSLTVLFDDEKTTLEEIGKGMKKEGYPVEGLLQ
ncbi:MAG: hypothetical protein U0411_09915 [Thermodesulfovibrionales bacterium]